MAKANAKKRVGYRSGKPLRHPKAKEGFFSRFACLVALGGV